MARFYGLPMRASGSCAANVPDGQAMWETSNSLWSAVQSGTNMVYHAAGWLEGGLIASPREIHHGLRSAADDPALYGSGDLNATGPDEIRAGCDPRSGRIDGHFFGIQHTQDRYTTAFYQPFLSDWRNFEAFEQAGGVWTAERAHKKFKEILAEFEAPPMDEAIRQELAEFVERRKAEGGAPTDF